ncbi:AMP-dependent synthetase/ligase [Spirochaeta thermophila]|uniref:AMP-dependent synthetase/ligase domain-containing protein n=1 Tax=Winmispira thermophila (strain ATCC 49972 / DSM 6192 / RI 19.B1) TaxID=665571 RepID=E0RS16_WINT6|nr:AMP-binding protein [Spirochaeta thermophila]ADN01803.1 hypothetical protein STHERM_c08540 [Spirochaeta thermophila DSM 6192]
MSTVYETLPQRMRRKILEEFPEAVALYVKDSQGVFQPTPYREWWSKVKETAAGLKEMGIERGEHVGLISDNRWEWITLDMALLSLGAVDVPRGSDSTAEEIAYILSHAECRRVIIENPALAHKVFSRKEKLGGVSQVILIEGEPEQCELPEGVACTTFAELAARGKEVLAQDPEMVDREIDQGTGDDLATIIYTSGTTGEPKGVMLPHRSFIFQIDKLKKPLNVEVGDIFLSILPIWHSFERAVDYILMERGGAVAYSKPVGKILLEDMTKVRPQWLAAVPRVFEGIRNAVYRNVNKGPAVSRVLFHFFVGVGELYAYFSNMFRGLLPDFLPRNRILDKVVAFVPLALLAPFRGLGEVLVFRKLKAKLGGRFKTGVSGGGALPPHVDTFFQAVGIQVLEGYGLTETGPVLAVRDQKAPMVGTVGPLLDEVEYKVLDEHGNPLPPGHKGVLWVKSPQVMLGYYKRPEATAEVLKDGWLNTGDLVRFTHGREFAIVGRAKDTIVLRGGENVEPGPIEEKLKESEFIENAVVVGQDQKFLGALIVPNRERIEEYAREKGLSYMEYEDLVEQAEVQEAINDEIQRLISPAQGFKPFERIFRFEVIPKSFEVGVELTPSLKVKRHVISEMYREKIERLFSR